MRQSYKRTSPSLLSYFLPFFTFLLLPESHLLLIKDSWHVERRLVLNRQQVLSAFNLLLLFCIHHFPSFLVLLLPPSSHKPKQTSLKHQSSHLLMRSTLPDPYESLPTELFLETLSALQPLEIARSQRVCKSWRDFVLSNSILHREIYLSNQQKPWERLFSRQKFNHDSNLEKITIPLSRQAALSKDKLVDVTLKLENLRWETQESGETALDEILSILVPSISTLRNLNIWISEEMQRSEPIRFGILRNKEICASLQHLQLDLDSRFCEMDGKDSLSTLLQCGRLKTLIIKDQGPVECEMNEESDPILSQLQLFTILRRHSESLEILEIRNLELKQVGSLQTVEDEWDQISFSRLESLKLVGLAPSLLSFLSLTKLPVLSKLKLSTDLSRNWREEVELISLELLGELLESASDCLQSIDFELLDAEGGFDTEIWLPKLENLSLRGCYPAMREARMEIKVSFKIKSKSTPRYFRNLWTR